jgi:hypothetical protein
MAGGPGVGGFSGLGNRWLHEAASIADVEKTPFEGRFAGPETGDRIHLRALTIGGVTAESAGTQLKQLHRRAFSRRHAYG